MDFLWQTLITAVAIAVGAAFCLFCFRGVFWLFRLFARKTPKLIPELLVISCLISLSLTVAVATKLTLVLGP
jgi:hypothetical protein